MLETILRVIAPHRCSACGEKGALLCESCKSNIVEERFEGCVFCLRPARYGCCPTCRRRYGCTQAWCLGERSGSLKQLGDTYKFGCSRAGAEVFADLLDTLLPVLPSDVRVVSIPTTAASIRRRGFDHVGLVARRFAKLRRVGSATPLVRASHTTLHFLSFQERTRLGKTLFALSGEPVPSRVVVMDDILTTGTTLLAATQLLRTTGVKEIYVVVWARQPLEKQTP